MTKKFYFLFLTLMTVFTSYSQVSKDTVKVINLSDVQVTGIRPGVNTPISQKTITSLDISKDYHGQEMTYVLEKTPSVTTQSDGGQPNGYTYFKIRGIDQTRINVTINGSPLNESEDLGCYYSNYPGFATYLKSVQVQRGVGTSSNGTSSYGGSINFESKDGLDKNTSVNISIGSFNTQMLNVSYGSGLTKNKTAFFGGISTYKSDGYRQHSGGSGSSGFFSGGYYGDKDVIKITSFTGLSKNSMAWLPTPESLINLDRTTNILSNLDKDNFNQSFIQLQEVHKFYNDFIMTNTLFYNNLNGMFNMNDVSVPSTWCYEANYKSNFYGYNSNFKYNINNFKLNTGYNINLYNRKHFGSGISDYDYTYDNIGYKNDYSLYFKPEYFFGKFNLYGDLQLRKVDFRYKSNEKDTLGNNIFNGDKSSNTRLYFNYRFGTTYTLSNTEKIYTSIGKTQREPTRTDMFKGNEYYLIGKSDINMKSESVIDYELGYKLNTSNLNINVNLYYMYFNNQYLPTGKYDSNSLMEMTPVDKSYRTGIEFDGKYKITDKLSTSNNTTLSNNKILSNGLNNMLYTPSVIINQDVEYITSNFYVNLSVRYLSKSQIDLTDKNAYCPSYMTLNSKIGLKLKPNIDLSVSCLNLTNTKYYTSGGLVNGEKGYFVGSPISFYTTVKVNF